MLLFIVIFVFSVSFVYSVIIFSITWLIDHSLSSDIFSNFRFVSGVVLNVITSVLLGFSFFMYDPPCIQCIRFFLTFTPLQRILCIHRYLDVSLNFFEEVNFDENV